MISLIFIVVVIAGAGYLAWRRWTYWRTPISPQSSAERSLQTRAFEAFADGNRCLMAGQWADATAAFERARTLDPKRAYVAERLAEVDRRQHAVSTPAPVAAGG
jgi:cytochrome c-type biogenesis protein CcmH/NrfG